MNEEEIDGHMSSFIAFYEALQLKSDRMENKY